MDLKSMLNDSSAQRHQQKQQQQPPKHHPPQPPRLHTPQSSYDQAAEHTPVRDNYPDRPPSYPPSTSRSTDSRSPSGQGYFPPQSPHPQTRPAQHPYPPGPVVTPGVNIRPGGGNSLYASSPGSHGIVQSPRDPTPNTHFPYSPSPSVHHPPTPGHVHHHPNPSASSPYTNTAPPPPQVYQQPRDNIIPGGGPPHNRQLSPHAQFHAPPTTPLGPPAAYPRPSPQPPRPVSQGYDTYRRTSFGSVGSQGKESQVQPPTSDQTRGVAAAQRSYSTEEEFRRTRERSIESVSPKTVPKPPPIQRTSSSHHLEAPQFSREVSQGTPGHINQPKLHDTPDRMADGQQHEPTPPTASIEPRSTSQFSSAKPSPAPMNSATITPKSTNSPLPMQPTTPIPKQQSLKRKASMVSTTSVVQPPSKRLRRDDVPVFAQSARRKPPRIGQYRHRPPPASGKREAVTRSENRQVVNGQNRPVPPPEPQPSNTQAVEPRWEPSITNQMPYEDLTRNICDWIVRMIGMATPPTGGAMFEIEAKVGEIFDVEAGGRLNLPVSTETIFEKHNFSPTKFESSMNMAQHKQLNAFLNGLVRETFVEAQSSSREIIRYDHMQEFDEFFELTTEGRHNLPQSIIAWLNPKHKPKVRRTTDKKTGNVKAEIIKSRIADLDIYNPRQDFDYRISISIESPWIGESSWLIPTGEGGRDRGKDRMSYRHLAYQIDLTQVSYQDRLEKEHELEVEISTEQIRLELGNLQAGRPSRYEDLVKGFLDNVRILCRRGTVNRH